MIPKKKKNANDCQRYVERRIQDDILKYGVFVECIEKCIQNSQIRSYHYLIIHHECYDAP